MARIDTWMKRLRSIGQKKAHERVLTRTSKFDILTSTQAVRFRKLKGLGAGTKKKAGGDLQYKPHYPLPEACRALGVPVNRVLQSAASGELTCFLVESGLPGYAGGEREPGAGKHRAETPKYLALTPADCRAIENWGSVNVRELEYPADHRHPAGETGAPTRFRLLEPLWVDAERLVLRHPLPGTLAS